MNFLKLLYPIVFIHLAFAAETFPAGAVAGAADGPWQAAEQPAASQDGYVLVRGGTFGSGVVSEQRSPLMLRVEDFEIGEHPVTNAQYSRFVQATGHPAPGHWEGGEPPAGKGEWPVIFINRYDVDAYVAWLSQREDRAYRLPTRAEFEYAARGGLGGRVYPWGDEVPQGRANFDAAGDRDFARWEDYLLPARSGEPNAYGLYGMSGNVWHLVDTVEDPVRSNYKFRIERPSEMERQVMGGSWARSAYYLQAGLAVATSPGLHHPDIGFRLVREPVRGTPGFNRTVRRLTAVSRGDREVFLSWQLLPDDPADVRFNVYRTRVRYSAGDRINAEPLAGGTHFIDGSVPAGALHYYRVRPVHTDGTEGFSSEWHGVEVGNEPTNVALSFYPLPRAGSSLPVFGDLTGDGLLDLVVRFSNGNHEMSHDPGLPVEVEAFAHGGRFLWRRGLVSHRNAYGSASNVPVVVYDLDGDGRAEVICRYEEGEQVFLAVLNGLTGEVMRKTPWPPMLTDLARSSSRIMMAVAYLDGERPSIITQTGLYENEVIVAYDADLNQIWEFQSTGPTSGSGSHRIDVADVTGDGRDEIFIGSTCLNPDGTVRWSIYRQHPDYVIIRNFYPERPGREIFFAIETNVHAGGYMVEAESGRIIWKQNREDDPSWTHSHSAWSANILPGSTEIQSYISRQRTAGHILLSPRGELLAEPFPGNAFSPVEWDGLPGRELIHKGSRQIVRFNGKEFAPLERQLQAEGLTGSVAMVADLFGDFRDEIVVVGERDGRWGIHILTASEPTEIREYTRTSDREYRLWLARNYTGGYPSYFESSHPERPTLQDD